MYGLFITTYVISVENLNNKHNVWSPNAQRANGQQSNKTNRLHFKAHNKLHREQKEIKSRNPKLKTQITSMWFQSRLRRHVKLCRTLKNV